jgi:hypothetical protein
MNALSSTSHAADTFSGVFKPHVARNREQSDETRIQIAESMHELG